MTFEADKYQMPTVETPVIDFMGDFDLLAEKGGSLVFDVECYMNYFLIGFKSCQSGKVMFFEQCDDIYTLDKRKLVWIVDNFTLIGFNSLSYDWQIMSAAARGFDNADLKTISDTLIRGELRAHHIRKRFGYQSLKGSHIDLFSVAPSSPTKTGLKQYGARMHSKKLQDLPVHPGADLTETQIEDIRFYNVNDLDVTLELMRTLIEPLTLRHSMGNMYGLDLMSLSDAQIAERVISAEIEANTQVTPRVPKIDAGTVYRYNPPEYMRFYTEGLQKLFEDIRTTDFVVDDVGKIKIRENGKEVVATNRWKIKIGKTTYKLGIGGLHSSEKAQTVFSDDKHRLIDRDVASYYPAIILNQRLFPEHIGPAFLETYRDIYERRLKAKKAGDKSVANSLKICINGCFGKLGSRFSVFYSPDLLIQVTLTGQLSLLMLIEMLEWCEIPVISANTDGVVIRCPSDAQERYLSVVRDWERLTAFVTEETPYASLHSRDVNNYVAIASNGEFKAKGSYTNDLSFKDHSREPLMSNPNGTIITEAVMLFLKTYHDPHPITIDQTINSCRDIRKFLIVRKVRGGAVKDGVPVGKVIRWYMRQNDFSPIRYANQNAAGNKPNVPDSVGGCPLMNIDRMPSDIDRGWYIRKAHSVLKDMGLYKDDREQLELF